MVVISASNTSRVQPSGEMTYIIPSVSYVDRGIYKCTLRNKFGQASKEILVDVRERPVTTPRPIETTTTVNVRDFVFYKTSLVSLFVRMTTKDWEKLKLYWFVNTGCDTNVFDILGVWPRGPGAVADGILRLDDEGFQVFKDLLIESPDCARIIIDFLKQYNLVQEPDSGPELPTTPKPEDLLFFPQNLMAGMFMKMTSQNYTNLKAFWNRKCWSNMVVLSFTSPPKDPKEVGRAIQRLTPAQYDHFDDLYKFQKECQEFFTRLIIVYYPYFWPSYIEFNPDWLTSPPPPMYTPSP